MKADKEGTIHKASLLYYSLRKLKELDESVMVMPGHTSQPVAFDKRAIQSALREIVLNTPLLKAEENMFVQTLLERIPNPPENYLKIVERNISGYFEGINPIELEAGANRCAIS